jgi:transposase
VLTTNDLDLDPGRLLANYKNQTQVERGFRFLKDNSFRVSEIFLKKNTRVEALAMIMLLFIYSLTVGSGKRSKNGMKPSQTRSEDLHKIQSSRGSSSSFGQSKSR